MKAYSVDLHQKVIDAYNQQEESQRQLAEHFRVSLSFIQDFWYPTVERFKQS